MYLDILFLEYLIKRPSEAAAHLGFPGKFGFVHQTVSIIKRDDSPSRLVEQKLANGSRLRSWSG
jgi:hypothetical protein